MKFGLKDQDLDYMTGSIHACGEIDKAVLFGSRAKGNYKTGSDIDLAIYGEQVSFDVVSRLHTKLEEESPMPYFFDVVDFTHLENKELKEHIERVGVIIYERR
jgi:predicted nucleotidyltransferase